MIFVSIRKSNIADMDFGKFFVKKKSGRYASLYSHNNCIFYVYVSIKSFHFLPLSFCLPTEHTTPMDVEIANKKFLARSEDFWDALENSAWWEQKGEEDSKIMNGQ